MILGHKNARFLRLCYETFRDYDPTKWYVNIGERPVLNVINKQPHIIHRMDGQFGVRPNVCHMLYPKYDKNWRNSSYYSIHLFIRMIDWCLGYPKPPAFSAYNETTVWTVDTTFSHMCRDVLQFEQNVLK